jgi:hypothetical protein
LEMLSTCTCYSRLHRRWFRYMSPSYCTTWPSLILARFRFLLDHVSNLCCSTCQFSSGARVVLRLGHVSLLHWTMCRIFISPCGVTTIPCVSFFYSTTCLDVVHPRVSILLGHVSGPELPTCLFFYSTTWQHGFVPHIWFVLAHVSCSGSYMCHSLVRPCFRFLFNDVPVRIYHGTPIITSEKIISDLYCCTK